MNPDDVKSSVKHAHLDPSFYYDSAISFSTEYYENEVFVFYERCSRLNDNDESAS
jgi:hypothetical protein